MLLAHPSAEVQCGVDVCSDGYVCLCGLAWQADNVLLDENDEPIIADFGLAKEVDIKETHRTTAVKGTIGFIAPGGASLRLPSAPWLPVALCLQVVGLNLTMLECSSS